MSTLILSIRHKRSSTIQRIVSSVYHPPRRFHHYSKNYNIAKFSSSAATIHQEDWWWEDYRSTHQDKIDALPESKAVWNLEQLLTTKQQSLSKDHWGTANNIDNNNGNYKHVMDPQQYLLALDAAMAVFSLHVHSRIASMVGHGYYTIGPCGEELLSAAGMALQPGDSSALHYRHTGMSISRQLLSSIMSISAENHDINSNNINWESSSSSSSAIQEIILARARGYTVSKYDPVTGGVHCSIGGGPNEYVVTSTLSSQCPSAVGRALGYSLVRQQLLQQQQQQQQDGIQPKERPISFCTIGDGSLHNHHFLSSVTLARHAKHLGIKCPMVFGISNNGLSISYRTKNYIDTVFSKNNKQDVLLPVFCANSQDMLSVYDQTKQACDYARVHQSPCVIVYNNVTRRFGHAATDRQAAYLSMEQIESMASACVLQQTMKQAVEVLGYTTYPELATRWEDIHYHMTNDAFAQAIQEPKVTLQDMMDRVAPPLAVVGSTTFENQNSNDKKDDNYIEEKTVMSGTTTTSTASPVSTSTSISTPEKPQVLRKHMTRVFQELMEEDPRIVYLGEDVRHGGYYLVTEGLAKKFPNRILDFPPDETTLLGAGLGFAQLGLVPIVEIPYAKYLDCGVDLFYEIAIQYWLGGGDSNNENDHENTTTRKSTSQTKQNGMIIRLQGFDRGLFGGNFHTHNALPHIPPGVDVVCFSNGIDYVKGMRHAIHQAKAGRVVMVVDCTHLLNLRHVLDKDRAWEFPYPVAIKQNEYQKSEDSMLGFDTVHRYSVKQEDGDDNNDSTTSAPGASTGADIAVVSYGNGVVTSLQARQGLVQRGILADASQLDVIDCPYLSSVPLGIKQVLKDYDKVVFADICKEGPGSNVFSSMVMSLQQEGILPANWAFVGAPRTYNPLGSTVTFLNQDTVEDAVAKMISQA